jgi:hypothetical protein
VNPKLPLFAALALAASPLVSATLLFDQQRLDLGELSRTGDQFGTSVAVSRDGKTLAAGAAQASTRGTVSGAAYVFALHSGVWERDPQFPPTSPDTTAFDAYGLSIAVSGDGNVVAVGAPLHDDPQGNAGAVYVWERSDPGSPWMLRSKLTTGPDALREDQLGTSVALSRDGSVLVAGAPQPNPFGTPRGKAYIFEWQRDSHTWQIWKLTAKPQASAAFDFFGFSVSVSGDGKTVAVGAPGADLAIGEDVFQEAGAAYVFERGEAWSDRAGEDARLLAIKSGTGDELGASIAVSDDGRTLVAGAREAGTRQDRPGSAYIFERGQEGGWSRALTRLVASDRRVSLGGNRFGASIALAGDGEVVLAGAPGVDNLQGAAYLFLRRNGWADRAERTEDARVSSCTEGQDLTSFGQSVALAGGTAAVGAPLDNSGNSIQAGSVCAFDLTGVEITAELEPDRVVPGERVQYKFIVRNESSIPVSGTLSVSFDGSQLTGPSLECEPEKNCPRDGAVANAIKGFSDRISTRVSLEAGEIVTVTFTAAVRPEATGELLLRVEFDSSNLLDLTPNVVLPQPPPFTPKADLEITKKVVEARAVRGSVLHYIITVTNHGPSFVSQATVIDQFDPQAITSVSWTCEGAACRRRSGRGDIRETVSLPLFGKLTYKAAATTRVGTPVRNLVNKATVKPPKGLLGDNPGNNEKSATTILPRADLEVIILPRRDNNKVIPGDVLSIRVKVINHGEDAVANALVEAKLGLPNASRSCPSPSESDGCDCSPGNGDIDEKVNLGVGACRIYVLATTVGSALRGSVTSTAKVTAPAEVPDQNPRNNDAGLLTTLTPKSPLAITLPLAGDSAIPGDPVSHTYTISMTNGGPSDLLGATIDITFPSPFTTVTWICSPTNFCMPSSSNGDIHNKISLPAGQTLTYTVSTHIDAAALGSIEVKIKARPDTGEDSNAFQTCPQNCQITTALTPETDLAIVSHKGPSAVVPGNPLASTYILTVTNGGPSDAQHARVTHDFDPDLTAVSWTCVATDGSFCRKDGKGEVREDVTIRHGGSLTFTVKGTAGPAFTGDLTIKATVVKQQGAMDPTEPNESEIAAQFTPVSDLAISRHQGPTTVIPGSPLPSTYTFTMTNAGPSDARLARVTHDFDPDLAAVSWTCAALNASCRTSGQGEVREDVTLRSGGSLTFTVKGTASPAVTGGLQIKAEVKLTQEKATDPRPQNDSLSIQGAQFTPVADLAITKTYDPIADAFTIVVVNTGPSDVVGAVVRDQPSIGFAPEASWVCAALNGSCTCLAAGVCTSVADADGCPTGGAVLRDTLSLRVGGKVTYTLPGMAVNGKNVACVTAPPGVDPRTANNRSEAEKKP